MEAFKSFLKFVGLYTERKVDFITKLPLEISNLILRMLDKQSLKFASRVSHKWKSVCKCEKKRRQVRKNKIIKSEKASIFATQRYCMKNVMLNEDYLRFIEVAPHYYDYRYLTSYSVTSSKRSKTPKIRSLAPRTIRF